MAAEPHEAEECSECSPRHPEGRPFCTSKPASELVTTLDVDAILGTCADAVGFLFKPGLPCTECQRSSAGRHHRRYVCTVQLLTCGYLAMCGYTCCWSRHQCCAYTGHGHGISRWLRESRPCALCCVVSDRLCSATLSSNPIKLGWSLSTNVGCAVLVVDPRFVLVQKQFKEQQSKSAGSAAEVLKLEVPSSLLSSISTPLNQLSDADDPANEWIFGAAAELFEYQLLGSVLCPSGLLCVLTLADWAAWQQRKSKRATWGEFQKLLGAEVRFPNEKLPFLWAGRIVDAGAASVYQAKQGKEVTGFMLSSSSAES